MLYSLNLLFRKCVASVNSWQTFAFCSIITVSCEHHSDPETPDIKACKWKMCHIIHRSSQSSPFYRDEKAVPQSKYIFHKKSGSADQAAEQLSDVYSLQSITLPPLRRARQHRKIEVSCSGGDIEIEAKERKCREDTAPQGAETWPCATPPGLTPHWEERRGEIRKEWETADTGGDCEPEIVLKESFGPWNRTFSSGMSFLQNR